MDLKKLALSCSLITSLALGVGGAGCSDDSSGGTGGGSGGGSGGGAGGGGGGSDVTFPEPDCTGGPGTGETTYRISSLVLPSSTTNPMPGFDLDGEEDACDVVDFGDSIDNGLAYMTDFLDLAVSLSGESGTVNDQIDEAINGAVPTLVITLTVTGWNETGDDACVHVDLDTGAGTPIEDIEGVVEEGQLYVELGDFDITLPVAEAMAELSVHGAIAQVDVDTFEGVVAGFVDRGGETYSYASAASAPAGSLHATIYDVIGDVAPGEPADLDTTVDDALASATDMTDSGGNSCQAVSLGFTIAVEEAL